jgi:predicted DCC family thiol-disulfide oxidoreductase YuxK
MKEKGLAFFKMSNEDKKEGTHEAVPLLMLYDGLCGFCNGTVQWFLRHDKFDRFRFAAQQSGIAQEVLQRHGIDGAEMLASNSVYLVLDLGLCSERVLQRSDVMVQALLSLGGFWKFLGNCFGVVPRLIRDAGYTFVARNRFRLAGRYEVCPIPTVPERAKFLGVKDS